MNTPLNVFFLEDNDDLALRFTKLLEKRGHTIHRAKSVEEAIDEATKLERIDVFVVDLMIPNTRANFADVSQCVKVRDNLAALWGQDHITQVLPGQQTNAQQTIIEEMEKLNLQIMQNINRQGGIEFLITLKDKNRIGTARIAVFSSSNPDDPFENPRNPHPDPPTFQHYLADIQKDESRRRWFQKPVSLKHVASWISETDK